MIDIAGYFKFKIATITTSIKYPEIVYFKGDINNKHFKGNYYNLFIKKKCKGFIHNDSLRITLINKNNSTIQLKGYKVEQETPFRNYQKVLHKIFQITEENIYNPEILKLKEWENFKKKLNNISSNINDDLEFQIAFGAYARQLPFSHYYFYKSPAKGKVKKANKTFAMLKEINHSTCVLKIKSFSGSKHQMDSLITVIDNKKYKNLIVDLRGNYGGNHLSAFPLAEYIVGKPIIAGVFPNKNWYRKFNRIPRKEDYANFTEFKGGTMKEWFHKAKQSYGAYFKVIPSKKHFKGKVYVLTDRGTASTCEPIVYALKYHRYAIVIGEQTAGVMLSSQGFDLGNGITLRIPLNDYITYSGERIDKNGVIPHIKVKSKKALKYTLNYIREIGDSN